MHEEPYGYRVAHHVYLLTSCPGHLVLSKVLRTTKILILIKYFTALKIKKEENHNYFTPLSFRDLVDKTESNNVKVSKKIYVDCIA